MNNNNSHDDPRKTRDDHYNALRSVRAETQTQVAEQKNHINSLKAKRQDLRLSAASTAGNLGLRYQSATNDYVHLVRVDNEQVIVPPTPIHPEPIKPLTNTPQPKGEKQQATSPSKPKPPLFLVAGDTVLWFFTLIIGAFVGLGLATIAGLTWRSDSVILSFAVLLGIGVIGGLKIMVATLWRNLGQTKTLEQPTAWPLVAAISLTALGCFLDAYLGAVAIHTYIVDRAFNASDVPPIATFLPLALSITTPILIASGALAYLKGKREITDEEIDNQIRRNREQKAELARENALATEQANQAKYHAELEAKVRADTLSANQSQADHHTAIQELESQRNAQWQELKSNPEFKCLQGLIGQIDVLNNEIEEAEKQLTGYRISRGFEKSADKKSGEIALNSASETEVTDSPSTNGHAHSNTNEQNGYLS